MHYGSCSLQYCISNWFSFLVNNKMLCGSRIHALVLIANSGNAGFPLLLMIQKRFKQPFSRINTAADSSIIDRSKWYICLLSDCQADRTGQIYSLGVGQGGSRQIKFHNVAHKAWGCPEAERSVLTLRPLCVCVLWAMLLYWQQDLNTPLSPTFNTEYLSANDDVLIMS